jgi:hypothetical protein
MTTMALVGIVSAISMTMMTMMLGQLAFAQSLGLPTTIETTTNAPFQIIGNVSSIHFNTKDGHYYVNGTLKYNGHVTVTSPLAILFFTEKTLGVKETGIVNIPKAMKPGDTYNYNSDTGYTKNQIDRLRGP